MNQKKCELLWKMRNDTEIYPQEVTREEAIVEGEEEKLKSGYVSDANEVNGFQNAHYYKLDTYTDEDFESAKLEIEVEQLNHLNSIHGWITFWSILSIIGGVILFFLLCAKQ